MLRKLTVIVLAAGLLAAGSAMPVEGKKKGRKARVQKVPTWGDLSSPIRPGASLGGYCTFNFVYYQPGTKRHAPKAYIGTAGHCTDAIGERVHLEGMGEIGTVVYDSDLVNSTVDFSLVRIDDELIRKTNPQMLGWEGPKGIVDVSSLSIGDRIDVYGYGLGVGLTEQSRPRWGVLASWDDREYQADMPAVNGDSGAPLLHDETGTAFGIISRYGFTVPPSTDLGPLMPWVLSEVAKGGYKVKLATIK